MLDPRPCEHPRTKAPTCPKCMELMDFIVTDDGCPPVSELPWAGGPREWRGWCCGECGYLERAEEVCDE